MRLGRQYYTSLDTAGRQRSNAADRPQTGR
jgi:hypothetical protein